MRQREQPTISLGIGAALIGLVIGVLLGTRIFATPVSQTLTAAQQEYIVMVSTLFNYANPNYNDDYVAQRLRVLGSLASVAPSIESLAKQYRASGDTAKQQEANGLDRLAANISARVTSGHDVTPPPPLNSGSQQATRVAQQPQPSVTINPTGVVKPNITPASPNNPPPAQTPAANQPGGQTPAANQPGSTPKTGTLVSSGPGINVRSGPNQSSGVIRSLPAGTKVEILQIVDGEAVNGTEKRWYQIKAGTLTGYVYYTLVKPD